MEPLNMNVEDMAYIRSESEFGRARVKGFIEVVMGLVTGKNLHLLSFDEVVEKLRLKQAIYQGLQDIPIKNIDDLPSAVGFWLAYVENLSESAPNLNELDLPKAAEAFLESIDEQKS